MTFASALDYCPELLVKEGVLTRRRPTAAEIGRTSSSAGCSPRRWAGSTSASRSPSRKGGARRRGDRGDRPLHRAGRPALPGRGLDPRQGRQAPAGHAVRRPHHRPLDDREPPQGRRPGPGDRGRQDDRHRPARRRRPGRPLRDSSIVGRDRERRRATSGTHKSISESRGRVERPGDGLDQAVVVDQRPGLADEEARPPGPPPG